MLLLLLHGSRRQRRICVVLQGDTIQGTIRGLPGIVFSKTFLQFRLRLGFSNFCGLRNCQGLTDSPALACQRVLAYIIPGPSVYNVEHMLHKVKQVYFQCMLSNLRKIRKLVNSNKSDLDFVIPELAIYLWSFISFFFFFFKKCRVPDMCLTSEGKQTQS